MHIVSLVIKPLTGCLVNMNVSNEEIQKFLIKGHDNSYLVDSKKNHLDLWFYQGVMSEFKSVISSVDNILHLNNIEELSSISIPSGESKAVIYDSGDKHSYMKDNPEVCLFKRMCCLIAVACDSDSFTANAPFQLGLEISRHTIATIKNHATHFLLPFDILLYNESHILDKHGADALATNLFNQNGYLFAPHVIPSIVTGVLMKRNLIDMGAFVAQPKALRSLCDSLNIAVDKKLDDRDINEDTLISLKILKHRYLLPINIEAISNLQKLEDQLQQDFDEISVKIGTEEVKITKTPE